jgi:arginase
VYVDAHADLHTEETTRSGYLQGMTLSLCLGRGPHGVARAFSPLPATTPAQSALLGVREWEPGERDAASSLSRCLPLADVEAMGPAEAAASALAAVSGPVVVHFNVDVIRPEEMPAVECVTPGGLTAPAAAELLRALVASPRVVALAVTQYDPDLDAGGGCAQRIVDLVASALARHVSV